MKATRLRCVLFAAVAAMGVCLQVGAVGQLEPGEVKAPGLYRAVVWQSSNAKWPVGCDFWLGDITRLFDEGSLGQQTWFPEISDPLLHFTIDLGTPHTLNRFAVRGRNDEYWGWLRISNMKISGSNDGVTWTDLFQLTKTEEQSVADVFTWSAVNYYPSNDTTTKYRYVKFHNFNQQCGHIAQLGVYSTDVMVEAAAANPFETTAINSGDHPDGVLLSAKLLNAPDATYDLVAYVSSEDHGDDLAAWQAAADVKSVTLGEKAANDTFVSARVAGLNAGHWYWRAFAVSGSTVIASDTTHPFSIGTTPFPAKAYVKVPSLKTFYDGVVGTTELEYKSADPWIVFDLSDLPRGKHVDSIRLWSKSDNKKGWEQYFFLDTVCDFGSSSEQYDWKGTVVSEQGDRVVEQVASIPVGITWTTESERLFNNMPYGTKNPQWLFKNDTVASRPRYLRLTGRTGDIRMVEAEIRLADDPGGLVPFVNAGDPQSLGTPSVPYGPGELNPGVEKTVSMAERDMWDGTGRGRRIILQGWTLTVTNADDEAVVTTSTPETIDTCSFTPAAGDKHISLVWHWKVWNKVPAKVMKAVLDTNGNIVLKNGVIWKIEDQDFSTYPGADSDSTDLLWDLGTSRPVGWFLFSPRNYTTTYRYKDFVLYGSNDAKTWTTLYRQGGVVPALNVWHEYFFETPQNYRYFRVGGLSCTEMSEFHLYSDAPILVQAGRAVPWTSESTVDSMSEDMGLDLNGKLVWSESGSANVTVYLAATDYEDDLAAWQQNGRAVSLGRFDSGEPFATHVANLKRGVWYWRAFATADGETVASSPALPGQTDTTRFPLPAYVSSGKGVVCDGSTTSGNPDSDGWLVFDLSKIPAGQRLAAIRIFPRNNWDGSWDRVVGSSIKFGYSDGSETWNVTKVVRDEKSDYPTSEASAIPEGIMWGEMGEVVPDTMSYWMWYKDNVFEVPIASKQVKNKPSYLYLKCTNMNIREVSLRLVKTPGMAIIVK